MAHSGIYSCLYANKDVDGVVGLMPYSCARNLAQYMCLLARNKKHNAIIDGITFSAQKHGVEEEINVIKEKVLQMRT